MKSNSIYNLAAGIFLVSLLISACGSAPTPTAAPAVPITGPATATTAPPTATEPPATAKPTSTPVPPTATQPSNEPVGAYRVKLPASPPGISAGYYRLTLKEDGSFTRDWAPTKAQDGLVGVIGTYAIEGNQITFTDVEGFAACTAEEGVSGTYEWSLSSQGLTLKPIEDTCEGRAYLLSTKLIPRDR
jgi:hypothetical protein